MPIALKWTLGLFAGFSLLTALWGVLTPRSMQMLNPVYLFPLSTFGVKHFFLWQVGTYFFIEPLMNVSQMIHFVFLAYLLYTLGMHVHHVKGPKEFLILFYGGGVIGGICAGIYLMCFSSPLPLFGPATALFSLAIAYMFLFPNAEILLFLTIPVRSTLLIVGATVIALLSQLAERNFAAFFATFSSVAFSYLYCVIRHELHSPFYRLHPFERRLMSFKGIIPGRRSKAEHFASNAKIYDFKTGSAILSDQEFMDACLQKIALHGKRSLSWMEKLRMKRISKKMRMKA